MRKLNSILKARPNNRLDRRPRSGFRKVPRSARRGPGQPGRWAYLPLWFRITIHMAKSGLSIGALKRYLKPRSREELVADIVDLFTRFDSVRDYYHTRLAPEDDAVVIEKYKAVIKNEFLPTRGVGQARLSVARKAVTEYRKVSRNKASLVDLMLYYVEIGVEFTNTYGDIDEAFYEGMGNMYKWAVELILNNELEELYERRCRRIVENTTGIGWGFHDWLRDIYEEKFEH